MREARNAVITGVLPSPASVSDSFSLPNPMRQTLTPRRIHSPSAFSSRPSVSSPSVNTQIARAKLEFSENALRAARIPVPRLEPAALISAGEREDKRVSTAFLSSVSGMTFIPSPFASVTETGVPETLSSSRDAKCAAASRRVIPPGQSCAVML